MKSVHNLTITVFIEQEEDEKLIAEHLTAFLPENFVDEKISMEINTLKIEEGRDIKKLTITLQKERHTKYFIKTLKEFLGEKNCQTIAAQENRVDESGKLYIRIDKTDFMEHESATLVDHGKCIHFGITIAAYPKKRSRAIEIVKELFSN